MKNKTPRVVSYGFTYVKMTKKIQEEHEKMYDNTIVLIVKKELKEHNAYPKKINKATRNGTKIAFETITDKNAKKATEIIDKIITDYEEKYNVEI